VVAIGGDRRARARLAAAVERACATRGLAGIHVDLEELDDDEDWDAAARIVDEIAAHLRPHGLEVAVDVPAQLDARRLARLGAVADRVVVMAYDEADEDGPAGPIASERFVDGALAAAAPLLGDKLVAGLGIYGYDWLGREAADPISFVAAQSAAKEAHALPGWDPVSGNPHFRYSDEEGEHEVWMLDAATLWNQLALVRRHRARAVALWRLGGEDPRIWDALAAAHGDGDGVAALAAVPADDRVENIGDGPFLTLALAPEPGSRRLTADGERITGESWERLPSPYLVRRGGIVPGKVALTFDDGPDPRFTPPILDALAAAGAPATFFVIGLNAGRAPALVRRAFDEGHEIGNHSYSHPDVDAVGDLRLRLELETTSRLVETLIGRRPLLYRPPSLADIEPRTVEGAAAFARAGSLGYLVVDADVDPRDWERTSAADLTRRVLDEAEDGGVVLLHDGGGDRSTTVEALPGIIEGLRRRGLRIVPLAELVGKRRDDVMPRSTLRPALAAAADHAVFGAASATLRWAGACLGLALALVLFRATLVIGLAFASEPRRRRRTTAMAARGPLPSATVVVPAYNEQAVIARTVESVLESDLPLQVLVVDDGSTDATAEVVRARFGNDRRVTLVTQPNGGKAAALRTGFRHAWTDVVVALDGDTLFAPYTVRQLLAPFADRSVGAVAGTAEVGNRENALTACQALEYLVQQELERRAWDALDALPVVPGAVGAWRRHAVAEAGGFSSDTLAEDADLSMALCRAGWKVVYAPLARARTEAPASVRALVRQRVRWSFGMLQAMWKHRRALVERRAGGFGRVVLPAMALFQVVLPLLVPAALLSVAAAAIAGDLAPALLASVGLFAVELAQTAAAARLAGRGWQRRAGGLLGWTLVARLVYRPLLLVVMARSLARVLDGIPLGWNKLVRRGTVA
jgi:cellulose synthase/poly-beta-1,6-N-acetylglucosamine synthase-like glycosyltransferase/peptidoglycan/xylan/chitin deacetylase (PgdA/CDA1 family)